MILLSTLTLFIFEEIDHKLNDISRLIINYFDCQFWKHWVNFFLQIFHLFNAIIIY